MSERRYRRMYVEQETPRDDQLIINSPYREIPKVHWCRGCPYATNLIFGFMCPFVEGSCARIPQTIVEPDPELVARVKDFYVRRRKGRLKERDAAARMGAIAQARSAPAPEAPARAEKAEPVKRHRQGRPPKLYEAYGEMHSLEDWGQMYGIDQITLYNRMKKGRTLEEALAMGLKRCKK